jgi:predicted transcriptional regulator
MKKHVAEIVAAYVGKNRLDPGELPALIDTVGKLLTSLGQAPEVLTVPLKPAVPIRRSVSAEAVTCLDCGWRGQMLRGHLTAAHGLSPHEYRSRWGLKPTHPIVAPTYAERRSKLAKEHGLGRRGHALTDAPRQDAAAALDPLFAASLSAPKRRGRRRRP